MPIPGSNIPDFIWPAIPDPNSALMMALQFQLEQSQWWPSEQIESLQFQQLQHLFAHAIQTVPYYHQTFNAAGLHPHSPLTKEGWSRIPILERETLQQRQPEFLSNSVPQSHGEVFPKKTSGSTGRQLDLVDTDANNLLWMAITLRDHLWHGREFKERLVSIRSGRSGEDPSTVNDSQGWGQSTNSVYRTGPSTIFFHTMPIAKQVEVLHMRQPGYLLVYPSNVQRLARHFSEKGIALPSLRGIITYGELLLPEVRDDCLKAWNVPVHDMYSCEELGYIALQCPMFDHYHCQSESVLVEVLNPVGQQCQPGEIGRLVITSLHNFAMPFIRYANLDYAEVGEPCPCGRGGLVLKRLMGRERNMAVGLDGKRFWPEISRNTWSEIGEVEELQLVQQSVDEIEVRAVSPILSEDAQARLATILQAALGQPYQFSFGFQDDIIRHANGKYERFVCNVD